MNNSCYELNKYESEQLISRLQQNFTLYKHIWENPVKFEYIVAGAIYDLDVSIKAIKCLAKNFNEQEIYFFSQNMLKLDLFSIVKVPAGWDDEYLPTDCSYLWASESLTIFGSSQEWFIQFNAELSLAILILKKGYPTELFDKLIKKFNQYEELTHISNVLPLIKEDLLLYPNADFIEKKLLSSYS
jgi:hypothetical protein